MQPLKKRPADSGNSARDRYIGRWAARIYRATHCYMAERLRDAGIGYGQFPFLLYLSNRDGACQEEISRDLYFDKGTTARALQKLAAAGLIRREPCATDRRKVLASITPTGKKTLGLIEDLLEEWQGILTQGFSPLEAEGIRLNLMRCTRNAQDFLNVERKIKCCR